MQVTRFSEALEAESILANQDAKIIKVRNDSGLAAVAQGQDLNHSKATIQTKNWITTFLVDTPKYAPVEQLSVKKE